MQLLTISLMIAAVLQPSVVQSQTCKFNTTIYYCILYACMPLIVIKLNYSLEYQTLHKRGRVW